MAIGNAVQRGSWVYTMMKIIRTGTRRYSGSLLRHAFVIWISDYFEQRLHAIASDRRNDPELGKMGTDGVDHRGLLADEQMARAMEHQAALLLGRLGLDEPHGCPGDRFADGLSVSGIVLLPLDVIPNP
jgi:hypothetical protein